MHDHPKPLLDRVALIEGVAFLLQPGRKRRSYEPLRADPSDWLLALSRETQQWLVVTTHADKYQAGPGRDLGGWSAVQVDLADDELGQYAFVTPTDKLMLLAHGPVTGDGPQSALLLHVSCKDWSLMRGNDDEFELY